jgi:Phycobilisome protein
MTPVVESLFDEVENRYLKPSEQKAVTTYMVSLNDRVATYRLMRDRELSLMQTVADQLTTALPTEPVSRVEQSIKMAILILRHSAMAMLMDDANYPEERFLPWLREASEIHGTQSIDGMLYPALRTQLTQLFNDRQMSLLTPYLDQAQQVLMPDLVDSSESLLTVAGLF